MDGDEDVALAGGRKAPLFLDVERSVCGRAWRDRLDDRARRARAVDRRSGTGCPSCWRACSPARGVEVEDVEAFLDPTVKRLMPDPDRLMDMAAAAARIADAVTRGEQVAIFGDYDVDGATSAALLARFLRAGGLDPIIHIPDRLFEGYGPNVEAVQSAGAARRDAAGHGRLRHHQPRAARGGAPPRPRRGGHRPSPGRRRAAAGVAVVNPNRLDDLSASAISRPSGSCS